jgi:hypothetical protein
MSVDTKDKRRFATDLREMYRVDSSEVERHVRASDGPWDRLIIDLDA